MVGGAIVRRRRDLAPVDFEQVFLVHFYKVSHSGHCEEHLRRSNPYFLCRTMDCFAALAMTEDTATHSRGAMRPSYARNFPPPNPEGAGNAGCALHPRSHARSTRKRVRMSIQGQ